MPWLMEQRLYSRCLANIIDPSQASNDNFASSTLSRRDVTRLVPPLNEDAPFSPPSRSLVYETSSQDGTIKRGDFLRRLSASNSPVTWKSERFRAIRSFSLRTIIIREGQLLESNLHVTKEWHFARLLPPSSSSISPPDNNAHVTGTAESSRGLSVKAFQYISSGGPETPWKNDSLSNKRNSPAGACARNSESARERESLRRD